VKKITFFLINFFIFILFLFFSFLLIVLLKNYTFLFWHLIQILFETDYPSGHSNISFTETINDFQKYWPVGSVQW